MQITTEEQKTALQVVMNPQKFHDQPASLQAAWVYLKSQRGQDTRLENLGPPRHDVRLKATPIPSILQEALK